MDKIAILIPCYNEEITIYKVVTDMHTAIPEAVIYVYDNNSTDNTAKIAQQAGAIVRHSPLRGKGNVIRQMFKEINAKCYLLVDGDDTYPSNSALEMCNLILQKKADMVIGDRLSSTYFQENKRLFHNSGNILICKIINFLFKANIKDVLTGYRAFSNKFVKNFPALSKNFEVETEMTIFAIKNNLSYINIPIQYRDRPKGSKSKLNTYKDGIRILYFILKSYIDFL